MHIQHAVTPTQLRLHEERKERMSRIKQTRPPVPRPKSRIIHIKQYRLVYECQPEVSTPDPIRDEMPRSIRKIITEVATKHGFTFLDVISPRRAVPIVAARHEAMWRARHETPHSLPRIGTAFNRDHTTVMHAISMHEKRMALEVA